jgi:hypothetical protein
MNKEVSLGQHMVQAMSDLTDQEWKSSLMEAFQDYEKHLNNEEDTSNPWFYFLDLIALKWGFYGDLDLYLKDMEKKLSLVMLKLDNREQINGFILEIGNHKDEHDLLLEQMKKDWNQ